MLLNALGKDMTEMICERCGKTLGPKYWYDKEQKLLPDKKYCSQECFQEAYAEVFAEKKGFFDPKMSDEEIEKKIVEIQIEALKSEGAISTLPVISGLLRGGDARLTGMYMLLRGIYQQNKMIILQNELIRRRGYQVRPT